MIDFIVKYWIEFLFGLIISGMGVMAKLMYNQYIHIFSSFLSNAE